MIEMELENKCVRINGSGCPWYNFGRCKIPPHWSAVTRHTTPPTVPGIYFYQRKTYCCEKPAPIRCVEVYRYPGDETGWGECLMVDWKGVEEPGCCEILEYCEGVAYWAGPYFGFMGSGLCTPFIENRFMKKE